MLTSSLSGRNLLNLSLSRQALLWNPGMLQLASLILSLRNENYNQFHQQHTFQEHNPFHGSQPQENQPEIPTSYQPGMAVSPVACPPLLSQNQQRQPSLGEFASDFVHPQQDGLEIPVPKTNGTLISEVNYIQQTADVSLANMNFLLEDEEQNLVVDTFVSTPLSDTTPSSSTPVFVNSSPEEEEDKDSYFSSFLDFDFSGHISTTNCCFD
ncbi:hypothetical protein SAY87_030729 [Trapa incisa]|uniref:Uncharacterized protein n=1 Tax=Trapa incisa TaxID=236973 RepID=A0AAN7KW73_9MYRT|nr:hypothetical protein SAY87_030729 [Trapa incisa]